MKKNLLYIIISFLILSLSSLLSNAQETTETKPASTFFDKYEQQDYMDIKKGWYFNFSLGTSILYGDVTNYGYLPKYKDLSRLLSRTFYGHVGKRLKYGIATQLELSRGNINGFKSAGILDPNKYIQSRTTFLSLGLSARYPLSDLIFREISRRESGGKFAKRFTIFATLGPGVNFYRSYHSYIATNRVIDYYGYEALVTNPSLTSLKPIKHKGAFELNYGLSFVYKLNQNADINLGIRYSYLFTDRFDAFVRPNRSRDNFALFSLGFTVNIGRTTADDIPKEWRATPSNERKKIRQAKNRSRYEEASGTNADDLNGKKLSKKDRKRKEQENDEFLKKFDAQLKLFELQRQLDQQQQNKK